MGLTLKEIFDTCPSLNEVISSEFMIQTPHTFATFEDGKYEVRFFIFQTKEPKQNFYEFCEKHDLLTTDPKEMDLGYATLTVFNYREDGDYLTVSLRKI